MSKRRGHKHKPKAPSNKSNGAKFKEDRLRSSSRGSKSVKSASGVTHEDRPTGDNSSWGKGGVLKDIENPSEVKKDLSLLNRALKGRWNLSDQKKQQIQDRLMEVVEKREVTVASKDGVDTVEEPADRNAVAATRVLVQMHGQDLEADQFEAKNGKPEPPQPLGNIINVFPGQPADSKFRASPLLQLAYKLGARELIIDGSAVPITDNSGEPSQAGAIRSNSPE